MEQAVACASVMQRARVRSPVATIFSGWGFFRCFFSPVRQMPGSFKPELAKNVTSQYPPLSVPLHDCGRHGPLRRARGNWGVTLRVAWWLHNESRVIFGHRCFKPIRSPNIIWPSQSSFSYPSCYNECVSEWCVSSLMFVLSQRWPRHWADHSSEEALHVFLRSKCMYVIHS